MDDTKNILNSDAQCPSAEVFYNYLEHKMNPADQRTFEKHLADCPFCMDALEGFQKQSRTQTFGALEQINEQINQKVEQSNNENNSSGRQYWMLGIAASITFVFLTVGIYLFMDVGKDKSLALETKSEKEYEAERLKEQTSSTEKTEAKKDLEEEGKEEELDYADESDNSSTNNPVQSDKTVVKDMIESIPEEEELREEDIPKSTSEPKFEGNFGGGYAGESLEEVSEIEVESEEEDQLLSKGADHTTSGSVNQNERFSAAPLKTRSLSQEKEQPLVPEPTYKSSEERSSLDDIEVSKTEATYNLKDAMAFAEMEVYNLNAQNKYLSRETTTVSDSDRKQSRSEKKSKRTKATAISEAAPTADQTETGVQLYNQKKFKDALSYFETEIKRNNQSEKVLVFKTLSLYQLKEYSKALKTIESSGITENNQYYPTRLWLTINLKRKLGLTYDSEYQKLNRMNSNYQQELKKVK